MRSRLVPPYALVLVLALCRTAAYAAPPVANAGAPQFAECVGGVATFTLDGTASTDEDGDALTYTWTGPFGAATGPTVEVEVPLGNNEVTLEVDDGNGGTSQATTNLIVIDTNPPAVGVALNPSLLIPPDGTFREVQATVQVQDVCDVGSSYTLHSITSNEPVTQIVVNADYGTPDTEFLLGALLTTQGVGTGSRTYTVIYEGEDTQGNKALGGGEVLVAKEGVLDVTPTRLLFRHAVGGPIPAAQSFQVSSIIAGAAFEVSSSEPWVTVSQSSGYATTSVDVTVDPTELGVGSHIATLTVSGEHGLTQTVRVQLLTVDRPAMFVMPSALSFEHDVSLLPSGAKVESAPKSKSVFVGALHASAPFTVTTDTPWLAATSQGATPARVTVTAFGEGMEIGDYTGFVRITPHDPHHEELWISVELRVIASRGIQVPEYLVNAATMERRPLAPGSLVTGFWDNPFVVEESASGLPLPTTLGGVSATVGGLPVRFSYVSRRQFNAQLPMELPTGVSQLELRYGGEAAGAVPVQILPASPGIFHANGDALALNQDGSRNGWDRPAPEGSGVALFLTGQGWTNPLVPDGTGAPSGPFAEPVHSIHLVVDGETVQPLFAALAPGLAGLLQINVPTAGLAPGAHTVAVSINGAPSNGVKIYVGP